MIASAFTEGKKLLLFGNGGSATDASHMAAEFVNRFKRERPGLPAIALTTDMAVITSIANDYDYSEIFARQIKSLSDEGTWYSPSAPAGARQCTEGNGCGKEKKAEDYRVHRAKGEKFASKADFAFIVPRIIPPGFRRPTLRWATSSARWWRRYSLSRQGNDKGFSLFISVGSDRGT